MKRQSLDERDHLNTMHSLFISGKIVLKYLRGTAEKVEEEERSQQDCLCFMFDCFVYEVSTRTDL